MLLNKSSAESASKVPECCFKHNTVLMFATLHQLGELPVTAAPEAARRPQWPVTDSAPENQREVKGQKFINLPYQVLSPAMMQEIASPLPWVVPKRNRISNKNTKRQVGYQQLIKIDCIFNTALCLNSLKMFVQARVFHDLKLFHI